MDVRFDLCAGLVEQCPHARAERLGKLDVRDDPVVEKCTVAFVRLVDDLIANDQVARRDLFAKTSGRAAGDHVCHAERLKGVDIRAIRHDRRVEQMAWPMP